MTNPTDSDRATAKQVIDELLDGIDHWEGDPQAFVVAGNTIAAALAAEREASAPPAGSTMTDTLSPERVAEIRALAEKATPEVLYVCESCADGAPESRGYASAAEIRLSPSGTRYCEFCYEQETDLPAPQWKDAPSVGDVTQAFDGLRSLLASHEALRAEVETMRGMVKPLVDDNDKLRHKIFVANEARDTAAREMREACAAACDGEPHKMDSEMRGYGRGFGERIRALPLPSETKE